MRCFALIILIWMSLVLPTNCASPTDQVITRLNYDLVLKRIDTFEVVTDVWTQTFVIQTPDVDSTRLQESRVNCQRLASSHDNDCDHITHLVDFLRNISNKAVKRINHTLTQVNDLIRQFGDGDQTNPPRHFRRGLLNFVGEISHSLFGTARNSDISKMHAAMRHYERNQASLSAAWRQIGSRLTSLSKSVNSRLDHMMNMMDLQRQTMTELYAQVREETLALDHASSLIALALAKFEEYSLLLDNLNAFRLGIELLSNGFLSPKLIRPTQLRNVLNHIN